MWSRIVSARFIVFEITHDAITSTAVLRLCLHGGLVCSREARA
ncbi:hypothetical protein ACFYYN_38060 [Streptomyces sp. NPDC001902]